MTLIEMMKRNVELYPQKTALIYKDLEISYEMLYEKSKALSNNAYLPYRAAKHCRQTEPPPLKAGSFTCPLMIVAAIVIKVTSKGPVLFFK